ncbi:HAD-IB family hydrolase [Vibrio renipiscarius]
MKTNAMNLALFDFDGTITNEDAYTAFLFYATPKIRLMLGGLLVSPIIALYHLKWLPARYTRPILTKMAFGGRAIESLDARAKQFVTERLVHMIRPNALAKIRWHQQQGDDIYVISASLSPYLSIWCQQQGIKLLCSTLAHKNGHYTGGYLYGDCSLDNKVTAIKRSVDLAAYPVIYAYGDTYEDLPMLALADHKFYQWQRFDHQDDILNLSQ